MAALQRHMLVIDDDLLFCDAISCTSQEQGMQVHTAHSASAGIALCGQYPMDVVLLDQYLPDRNGVEMCPAILSHNDRTKIILATAYPDFNHAVVAIKCGAFDYLAKPFDIDTLSLVIRRALQSSELDLATEVSKVGNCRGKEPVQKEPVQFVGSSSVAQCVRKKALLVAGSSAPVLITGPTGTGKSLLAQYIHCRGKLRDKGYIAVNCAVLPESLIEAELFGVEKGAYTDAGATRRGLFEMAAGGTLFLDEIATLPLHFQAKLLGVLDESRIKRLGGETSRKVDVRIIAATNCDLREAVRQGRFREDLFYRLSVVHIELPSLGSRVEDIPELCRFFLAEDLSKKLNSQELSVLMAHSWPGNVRELKNILEQASLLGAEGAFRPSQFVTVHRPAGNISEYPTEGEPSAGLSECSLKDVERNHIALMLRQHKNNRTRVAQILDISRSTLIRKMKEYGLVQLEPSAPL